jgi:hypothetical protein
VLNVNRFRRDFSSSNTIIHLDLGIERIPIGAAPNWHELSILFVVTDYLRSKHLTAHGLWELAVELIQDNPETFLLVDDSVQDKRYSQFIELVKLQYSGAEHGLVRGIGIVNLVHSVGEQKDFYPIDYRIYTPDQDGKTKNEHFSEMVISAVHTKKIKAKRILFDSWYTPLRT